MTCRVSLLSHFPQVALLLSRIGGQDHRRDHAAGITVLAGFGTEPLQMFQGQLPLLHRCHACAAVNPDRFPNTITSSSANCPSTGFRPCKPPEASPATNRFFTFVSEFGSIFTAAVFDSASVG